MDYHKLSEACKITGLCSKTLTRYAKSGKIKTIILPTGRKRYDVSTLRNRLANVELTRTIRREVCYCRVSTHGQKDNLNNQIKYMKTKYPDYERITDVGSGINFKRPGIKTIIDYAIKGELATLVVSYKDRLCRIGYDLLEHIFTTYSNTRIIIDANQEETVNEEMARDIVEIITVYSARLHGMRSYKKAEKCYLNE